MRASASVVIIGGGISGTSTAFHLCDMGQKDVVLVEKSTLSSGSTSRANGTIERQLINELDIKLRVKSFEVFKQFIQKGVDFHQTGYVRLAANEKDIDEFHESVRIQRSLGVDDSRVLTREELGKLLPHLKTDDLLGALYGPSDGVVDPSQLNFAFAREAERLGADLVQNVPVTGIRLGENGKHTVITSEGEIRCDYIVNAAGAWASQIGAMAGLMIPVKPVRAQTIIVKAPFDGAGMMPDTIDLSSGLYLQGSGSAGKLFYAGYHSDVLFFESDAMNSEDAADPETYNQAVDQDYVMRVVKLLLNRAPGLSASSVAGGWAGLYEMTPDSRPIIGEAVRARGFVNCTGFSGYGIQLSGIAGKLAAETIVKGSPATIEDISLLSLERFEK